MKFVSINKELDSPIEEGISVQQNHKNKAFFLVSPWLLIGIGVAYIFISILNIIMIAAITSSNNDALRELSLSVHDCPSKDAFSSTTIKMPTVTSNVNISSSTSSQAHTFPSTYGSTQAVTNIQSDSPSITTEILPTTETSQSSTSRISSTTLSTTPTSESTYSAPTPTIRQLSGFAVMQDLESNLTVSGPNYICIKTCSAPDSYRVNLNFTMRKEDPKLNYTVEAIMVGNSNLMGKDADKENCIKVKSLSAYIAIEALFPEWLDQVRIENEWKNLPKPCSAPMNSIIS